MVLEVNHLALREVGIVKFPFPTGININMMPIVHGDIGSVPEFLHGYLPIMGQCLLPEGVAYLSIQEGVVPKGGTLRRPGIHTDGGKDTGWGEGGGWGATQADKGIYMASSDGLCRAWDILTWDVDEMGALEEPTTPSIKLVPNMLYWMTDRTPHESLPAPRIVHRQWFRLVSGAVGVWWAQHSTANPLGVRPTCPIRYDNKFER